MSEPAAYFDGRSAVRHDVALHFGPSGIRIEGGSVEAFWAYADIRYSGADADDPPLAFRCDSAANDTARLIVEDRNTRDALRTRCPDLEDRGRRDRRRRRGVLWGAAGLAALGLIVWSSIHLLPRIVAPLVPVSWEEALGDRVVEDIAGIFGTVTDSDGGRCDDPAGRAALDHLVGRLAGRVETAYRFEVVVLDIDMVNALAAPGGRIVVLGKLLAEARTADEVAGVVAHEMGHVISRHPTQAVARGMGISFVFNLLLGGLGSGATGAVGQALLSNAYSRDAESEADAIAFDILRGAGISPEGLADFFDRLAAEEGAATRAFAFVSTHPPSEDRARAARAAAVTNARPALSETDWKALKAICGAPARSPT